MKLSKVIDYIWLDLIRLLKMYKRVKFEVRQVWPIVSRLRVGVAKLCRHYDKTKLGICLAVGIMLLPAALLLHPVVTLQKIMKPVKNEQQGVSAPTGPQEELSGDGHELVVAGRARVQETSRGGQVDRESVNLLAQVIEGEAADEPYEGKVAVGAVILNRTESGDFPHTIPGVIYELDAFESVSNGQYQRYLSPDSMNAAADALNGSDPTGGALYFWNPAKSSSTWVWSRPIVTQIGRHVFAR